MVAITRHSATVTAAPMPITDQKAGQKYQAKFAIVLTFLGGARSAP